mgnify:FL=1
MRYQTTFEILHPKDQITISLKGKQLFIHHLLLRKEDVDVWQREDSVSLFNNYFLERPLRFNRSQDD